MDKSLSLMWATTPTACSVRLLLSSHSNQLAQLYLPACQCVSSIIAKTLWCPICMPDGYLLRVPPSELLLACTLEVHHTGGVIMGSGGVKLVWNHCRCRSTQGSQSKQCVTQDTKRCSHLL